MRVSSSELPPETVRPAQSVPKPVMFKLYSAQLGHFLTSKWSKRIFPAANCYSKERKKERQVFLSCWLLLCLLQLNQREGVGSFCFCFFFLLPSSWIWNSVLDTEKKIQILKENHSVEKKSEYIIHKQDQFSLGHANVSHWKEKHSPHCFFFCLIS